MKSPASLLLTALSAVSIPSQPQEAPSPTAGPPDVAAELAGWRAEHGSSWRAEVDPGTGYADFLYGGRARGTIAPVNDAEWFTAAREFASETVALHGIEVETLVDDRVTFLPLGQFGTTDKWTVRFVQEVDGVANGYLHVNVLRDWIRSINPTRFPQ